MNQTSIPQNGILRSTEKGAETARRNTTPTIRRTPTSREGCLAIKAIQNGYYHGEKHDYTSARMTTKGKGDWLYGRFEARIKMPTGKGVWPAFWMMPTDEKYGGWARSGELDIVEEVGDKPGTAFGTIHYGGSWPNNVHTGDKWNVPSGASLSDDFHVYAVEWEPGTIRWYIGRTALSDAKEMEYGRGAVSRSFRPEVLHHSQFCRRWRMARRPGSVDCFSPDDDGRLCVGCINPTSMPMAFRRPCRRPLPVQPISP